MFSSLIGNDQIKTTLKRFLQSGRVPNSLLFVGGEGVGKKQFALELAKAFVCQKPRDSEACDECGACKRADKFTLPVATDKNKDDFKKVFFSEHGDVATVVTYKNNILVDAIRDLERQANFRPFEARARFFIIDDADKMNASASNALLKTLEEPAPTSHIFLITSRPASLLATIRSRCQMLRFAPVGANELEQHLTKTTDISSEIAALTARLSRGSVGLAASMDIEKFLAKRETMIGVLESVFGGNSRTALLRTAEEMNDAKNKENFGEYLDILQDLIHDVWRLRLVADEREVVNADILPQLRVFAEGCGNADLAGWLNEIELLRESLVVNINKKIAADALFMQMAGV